MFRYATDSLFLNAEIMDSGEGAKRITLKHSRPNPLFQEWLQGLHVEAAATNSPLASKLEEALESLSKYPLPLQSGAECLVLKGFDKKLCKFLDKRLEAQRAIPEVISGDVDATSQNSSNSGVTVNGKRSRKTKSNTSQSESVPAPIISPENSCSGPKKPKTRNTYKPAFRSGGYAILMALLDHFKENESSPSMKKEELIIKAQPYSEESFTRPKPESFYTAWSNMSRLVNKGLVNHVKGKKAIYSLTDEGLALAIEIFEETKNKPSLNDIIFNENPSSDSSQSQSVSRLNHYNKINEVITLSNGSYNKTQSMGDVISIPSDTSVSSKTCSQNSEVLSSSQEHIFIELPAGSFDVILLIDKMEAGGASKKTDPTIAQFNKYPDLKHEYRSLKVGDFTWVARHKQQNHELVLPYVVERKRMDDLGGSIKDGRFHEQKFRLRKCGLSNVIYLAENYGSNKHVGLPLPSLMQALTNTRVHDGFKVHITNSHSDSARFLAIMTKRLTIEYKDNHLVGSNRDIQGEELMTFEYFNKSSLKSKPLTVTETFIKLLLQLRGVSVEKALAITKVYKTPKSLIKAYEKCSKKEGETLLLSLKYGEYNRNVGPSVSKSIYQFFIWDD